MANFMKRFKSAKKWLKGTLVASLVIFVAATYWIVKNLGVEIAVSNPIVYVQGGAFLVILYAIWSIVTK